MHNQEEKISVTNERQHVEQITKGKGSRGTKPRDAPRGGGQRQARKQQISPRCWKRQKVGHYLRECPERAGLPRNGRWPGGHVVPRANILSGVQRVTGMGSKTLPLVMLSLKVGNDPALIDTEALFSCVKLDVAEFLSRTGEPWKFLPCSVLCSLAYGSQREVTDAVKFFVKLLKFTWNHEFKELRRGSLSRYFGHGFFYAKVKWLWISRLTSTVSGLHPTAAGIYVAATRIVGEKCSFKVWLTRCLR